MGRAAFLFLWLFIGLKAYAQDAAQQIQLLAPQLTALRETLNKSSRIVSDA
jgi:hypothetical protein